MNSTHRQKLARALQQLRGTTCWEVLAGRGTGSNFTLHAGGRVKRRRPLTNRTLSSTAKQFEGERILYVCCPWRLEAETATVTSWADAWQDLDTLMSGLARLKRARVTQVMLRGPAPDLRITFDNGLALVVFCDATELSEYPSYSFYEQSASYTVYGGRIEREARAV